MTKTFGDIKVERREIADLIPYAANSRTHSDTQVAQIAASIREFGWTNPILVSGDGTIIAGHGRLLAARQLGMGDIPVIVLDHLSEAQRKALVIADNKLALNAGWDEGLLSTELAGLNELNFDISLTGFDMGELAALFDKPNFEPGTENDQGRLDELAPKMVQCPHCGQEYDLREHGQG